MFNDEESFAFKKIHEFSTVDGFVEVSECLADMIKYVANEPSVGLFYIQEHTQNAVPNLIKLKNKVVEKSRQLTLDTEDSEDSISMVRSMRECGYPIADEMIRDIRSSLDIMSAKQPKRGLIDSGKKAFTMGRTSSWSPVGWGRNTGSLSQDGEKAAGYLSNVMKSTKQKAGNFMWPQMESNVSRQVRGEKPVSHLEQPLSAATGDTSSSMAEAEAEELPLSTQIADELREMEVNKNTSNDELPSLEDKYDEFNADREAKLEEWLGKTGN